jgi:hypothetical protein
MNNRVTIWLIEDLEEHRQRAKAVINDVLGSKSLLRVANNVLLPLRFEDPPESDELPDIVILDLCEDDEFTAEGVYEYLQNQIGKRLTFILFWTTHGGITPYADRFCRKMAETNSLVIRLNTKSSQELRKTLIGCVQRINDRRPIV